MPFWEISERIIAILGTVDTKEEEIAYAQKVISDAGCKCLVVDISTKDVSKKMPGISPLELLAAIDVTKDKFGELSKHDKVEHMRMALETALPRLYMRREFQGVLAIGGGQNARMTAGAMQKLPFGVPKIIASAFLCGNRTMEPYMGTKDIMVMHTVADIEGLNEVTKTVIQNACNAMAGMVGRIPKTGTKPRVKKVALTSLGVTTAAARGIRESLPPEKYEMTCFHANGVGGRCMEELVMENAFDLVVDMNLHEVTCELFGGCCEGASNRLEKTVAKGVPLIVVPGAIDMVDCYVERTGECPKALEGKLYLFHNSKIAHAKVGKEEAAKLAEVVAARLNKGRGEIVVVLPHGGFSMESAFGQPLYRPEVDETFMARLKQLLKKEIKVIDVDGNINEVLCQKTIVGEIYRLTEKGERKYEEVS